MLSIAEQRIRNVSYRPCCKFFVGSYHRQEHNLKYSVPLDSATFFMYFYYPLLYHLRHEKAIAGNSCYGYKREWIMMLSLRIHHKYNSLSFVYLGLRSLQKSNEGQSFQKIEFPYNLQMAFHYNLCMRQHFYAAF